MTIIRIVGAAALSIVLTGSAFAYDHRQRTQAQYDHYTQAFRGYHDMHAQDALNEGRTDIYPRYHSGWGGLYGDGQYPGSVDDNMGPPYLGRW
jgi:hypothetical protein